MDSNYDRRTKGSLCQGVQIKRKTRVIANDDNLLNLTTVVLVNVGIVERISACGV